MLTLPVEEASCSLSSSSSSSSSRLRSSCAGSRITKAERPEAGGALRDAPRSRSEEGGSREEEVMRRRGCGKAKRRQAGGELELERVRVRRAEANARERSRMRSLNVALDALRSVVPCCSAAQRLSKIDTLRLANNYIRALGRVLSSGTPPDLLTFAQALCRGVSRPAADLVAARLRPGARGWGSRFGAESPSPRPPQQSRSGPPPPLASPCGPYRRRHHRGPPRAGTLGPPLGFGQIFSLDRERCCSLGPGAGSALNTPLPREQQRLETSLISLNTP